jgi:hypothetical protein
LSPLPVLRWNPRRLHVHDRPAPNVFRLEPYIGSGFLKSGRSTNSGKSRF